MIKKETGFTLIELLVVIAIIGLLSTVAMVSLSTARMRSRDAKRVADVRQIHMSLELYNNNSNGYPVVSDPVVLGEGNYAALCSGGFKSKCGSEDTVFQGIIPSAPTPTDGDCSEDENSYTYSMHNGGEYQIQFCIGGQVGDFVAGNHMATPSGMQ